MSKVICRPERKKPQGRKTFMLLLIFGRNRSELAARAGAAVGDDVSLLSSS
jgi:hypothetical protein